jgi:hypothetical protein
MVLAHPGIRVMGGVSIVSRVTRRLVVLGCRETRIMIAPKWYKMHSHSRLDSANSSCTRIRTCLIQNSTASKDSCNLLEDGKNQKDACCVRHHDLKCQTRDTIGVSGQPHRLYLKVVPCLIILGLFHKINKDYIQRMD